MGQINLEQAIAQGREIKNDDKRVAYFLRLHQQVIPSLKNEAEFWKTTIDLMLEGFFDADGTPHPIFASYTKAAVAIRELILEYLTGEPDDPEIAGDIFLNWGFILLSHRLGELPTNDEWAKALTSNTQPPLEACHFLADFLTRNTGRKRGRPKSEVRKIMTFLRDTAIRLSVFQIVQDHLTPETGNGRLLKREETTTKVAEHWMNRGLNIDRDAIQKILYDPCWSLSNWGDAIIEHLELPSANAEPGKPEN